MSRMSLCKRNKGEEKTKLKTIYRAQFQNNGWFAYKNGSSHFSQCMVGACLLATHSYKHWSGLNISLLESFVFLSFDCAFISGFDRGIKLVYNNNIPWNAKIQCIITIILKHVIYKSWIRLSWIGVLKGFKSMCFSADVLTM